MMIKRDIFPTLLLLFHTLLLSDGLSRPRRTLVWPPGGSKLLVICGYGVPVDLKPETVIFGTVFKANYRFPTNATQITQPYLTYERKKRAATRWDIYDLLARVIEMRGFEGKACVLRSICEMAQTPLAKDLGLFHELIHVFFKPTSTNEKVIHHSDNEYYAAEYYGRRGEKCEKIFRDCSASLTDLFTIFS